MDRSSIVSSTLTTDSNEFYDPPRRCVPAALMTLKPDMNVAHHQSPTTTVSKSVSSGHYRVPKTTCTPLQKTGSPRLWRGSLCDGDVDIFEFSF